MVLSWVPTSFGADASSAALWKAWQADPSAITAQHGSAHLQVALRNKKRRRTSGRRRGAAAGRMDSWGHAATEVLEGEVALPQNHTLNRKLLRVSKTWLGERTSVAMQLLRQAMAQGHAATASAATFDVVMAVLTQPCQDCRSTFTQLCNVIRAEVVETVPPTASAFVRLFNLLMEATNLFQAALVNQGGDTPPRCTCHTPTAGLVASKARSLRVAEKKRAAAMPPKKRKRALTNSIPWSVAVAVLERLMEAVDLVCHAPRSTRVHDLCELLGVAPGTTEAVALQVTPERRIIMLGRIATCLEARREIEPFLHVQEDAAPPTFLSVSAAMREAVQEGVAAVIRAQRERKAASRTSVYYAPATVLSRVTRACKTRVCSVALGQTPVDLLSPTPDASTVVARWFKDTTGGTFGAFGMALADAAFHREGVAPVVWPYDPPRTPRAACCAACRERRDTLALVVLKGSQIVAAPYASPESVEALQQDQRRALFGSADDAKRRGCATLMRLLREAQVAHVAATAPLPSVNALQLFGKQLLDEAGEIVSSVQGLAPLVLFADGVVPTQLSTSHLCERMAETPRRKQRRQRGAQSSSFLSPRFAVSRQATAKQLPTAALMVPTAAKKYCKQVKVAARTLAVVGASPSVSTASLMITLRPPFKAEPGWWETGDVSDLSDPVEASNDTIGLEQLCCAHTQDIVFIEPLTTRDHASHVLLPSHGLRIFGPMVANWDSAVCHAKLVARALAWVPVRDRAPSAPFRGTADALRQRVVRLSNKATFLLSPATHDALLPTRVVWEGSAGWLSTHSFHLNACDVPPSTGDWLILLKLSVLRFLVTGVPTMCDAFHLWRAPTPGDATVAIAPFLWEEAVEEGSAYDATTSLVQMVWGTSTVLIPPRDTMESLGMWLVHDLRPHVEGSRVDAASLSRLAAVERACRRPSPVAAST